jgi:antitoxin component of MazEF toxin-antitoxin module
MAKHAVRTIQSKNNQCRIAIPRNVLQALGWSSGDIIAWHINPDDTITLSKIDAPPLFRAADRAAA